MPEEQQKEIEYYLRHLIVVEAMPKESSNELCIHCNDRLIEVKKAKSCNRCYQRERNREKREVKAEKHADAKRFIQ